MIILLGDYIRIETTRAIDVGMVEGMFVVSVNLKVVATYPDIADVMRDIEKRVRLDSFDRGVLANLLQKI